MYVDKQCVLCDDQEMVGASAASDYSDYAYNLGSTKGDPGAGKVLYVIINVTTAFASGSSTGTVVFAIIDEANTTLDGSSVVIIETKAIVVTSLTAGKIIVIPVPIGLVTQQYLGLKTTYGTETVTAGKIDAAIAFDAPANVPY